MPHKNDYTCIFFYKDGKPKKWEFVHSLSKFIVFVNDKHPGWEYMNVYERRTSKYLKRFYPNNIIPYFLSLFPIVLVLHFFLTFNNKPSRSSFTNGFNNTTTIQNFPKGKKGGISCQS